MQIRKQLAAALLLIGCLASGQVKPEVKKDAGKKDSGSKDAGKKKAGKKKRAGDDAPIIVADNTGFPGGGQRASQRTAVKDIYPMSVSRYDPKHIKLQHAGKFYV